MGWREKTMSKHAIFVGSKRKKITVRLGFPKTSKKHDGAWECAFQLTGLNDDEVLRAYGVDAIQALSIALRSIRTTLDQFKDARNANNESYQYLFPKIVPGGYDPVWTRRVSKLVDDEVKREDQRLAKIRKLNK